LKNLRLTLIKVKSLWRRMATHQYVAFGLRIDYLSFFIGKDRWTFWREEFLLYFFWHFRLDERRTLNQLLDFTYLFRILIAQFIVCYLFLHEKLLNVLWNLHLLWLAHYQFFLMSNVFNRFNPGKAERSKDFLIWIRT
jgi:hypothetical protein